MEEEKEQAYKVSDREWSWVKDDINCVLPNDYTPDKRKEILESVLDTMRSEWPEAGSFKDPPKFEVIKIESGTKESRGCLVAAASEPVTRILMTWHGLDERKISKSGETTLRLFLCGENYTEVSGVVMTKHRIFDFCVFFLKKPGDEQITIPDQVETSNGSRIKTQYLSSGTSENSNYFFSFTQGETDELLTNGDSGTWITTHKGEVGILLGARKDEEGVVVELIGMSVTAFDFAIAQAHAFLELDEKNREDSLLYKSGAFDNLLTYGVAKILVIREQEELKIDEIEFYANQNWAEGLYPSGTVKCNEKRNCALGLAKEIKQIPDAKSSRRFKRVIDDLFLFSFKNGSDSKAFDLIQHMRAVTRNLDEIPKDALWSGAKELKNLKQIMKVNLGRKRSLVKEGSKIDLWLLKKLLSEGSGDQSHGSTEANKKRLLAARVICDVVAFDGITGCWLPPFTSTAYEVGRVITFEIAGILDKNAKYVPFALSGLPLSELTQRQTKGFTSDATTSCHHPLLCELGGEFESYKNSHHLCCRPSHLMLGNSAFNTSFHLTLQNYARDKGVHRMTILQRKEWLREQATLTKYNDIVSKALISS